MLEPLLLPLLAKLRRELSRLVFLGLLCAYGLAALAVCGQGSCDAGARVTFLVILEQTRPYLWQGMAIAYLAEFAGGILAMTIGLAWDWWRERPQKAAAKAAAETAKQERAAAQEKLREAEQAAKQERAATQEKLRAAEQAAEAARQERAAAQAEFQAKLQAKDLEILARETELRAQELDLRSQGLDLRARELELRAQETTHREQNLSTRDEALAFREMLLRNGIDPDTGERLPNFNNGNGNGAGGKS